MKSNWIKTSLFIFSINTFFADNQVESSDDFLKLFEADSSSSLNQISQQEQPTIQSSSSTQTVSMDNRYPGKNRDNAVFSGKPFPNNSIANLEISGQFLYLSESVSDLYFAAFAKDATVEDSAQVDQYYYFDRIYKPAFLISANYSFSEQGWSLGSDWMQFHFNQEQTFNYPYNKVGVPILVYSNIKNSYLPTLNANGGYLQGQQKLHFDQVDIFFNKEFYLSKYFSLTPQMAGTFIWFNHHFSTTYGNNPLNQINQVEYKNDFHGFGFKFGGSSRFQFGQGIYVLGTGNVGVVYGPRNQRRLTQETALSPDQNASNFKSLTTDSKNRSDLYIPFFETRVDVGYRRAFKNNEYAIDLFIGYEYHLFSNAIMTSNLSSLYDITEAQNTTSHNLGLQGMNVGASFCF